ncbi:MAG TPA: HAD family phosphatase [Urbifossiella sp.]|jgi:beta-phosphoglucomutase|nr:HAD family phosphatase [Urbifossiella sp.]
MPAPRAAVWDVDGTLVDTAEIHFAAWAAFATAHGFPFTRADFAATFGKRNPEIVRQLFDPAAEDGRCAEWGEEKERLYRDATDRAGVALLPGVRALVEGLAAAGWVQGLGSSAPRANLDLILRHTGTADRFRAVVSGDDVTRGKPDPEVFLKAAAGLGVPADRCVVFEDAPSGVQAAKAAGMACVGVTFVGHHPPDRLRAAGADLVVPSLETVSPESVAGLLDWSGLRS